MVFLWRYLDIFSISSLCLAIATFLGLNSVVHVILKKRIVECMGLKEMSVV